MNYIELQCNVFPTYPASDMLMAELALLGYESFMENNTGFLAYIAEDQFNLQLIEELPMIKNGLFDISFSHKIIEKENWNSVWESKYEPVLITNQCYIRAPFHDKIEGVTYDLVIEPKMSFGTAHHETTALVIETMLDMDFKGKKVLDMGSGTGVLAILASKMGAEKVVAIDIDEWSYENMLENAQRNQTNNVFPIHGDKTEIPDEKYDIILANINRNILLEQIKIYAQHLEKGGILVLSGIYNSDIDTINAETQQSGFSFQSHLEKNNWVACRYDK